MHLINETRVVQLHSRTGKTVEGHEHIVGFDARVSGLGVAFERHIPVEVVADNGAGQQFLPIANDGLPRRILPYLAAPMFAIVATRLFRTKG